MSCWCNYHNQFTMPSTTKHCVICKHTPKPSMKSTTTTQIGQPVTTLVMKIDLLKMVYPEICPGMVFFLLIFSQALLQIYEVGPPHVRCIHHLAMLRLEHIPPSRKTLWIAIKSYVYGDLHIHKSVRKCTKKISWNIDPCWDQHCQEIVVCG